MRLVNKQFSKISAKALFRVLDVSWHKQKLLRNHRHSSFRRIKPYIQVVEITIGHPVSTSMPDVEWASEYAVKACLDQLPAIRELKISVIQSSNPFSRWPRSSHDRPAHQSMCGWLQRPIGTNELKVIRLERLPILPPLALNNSAEVYSFMQELKTFDLDLIYGIHGIHHDYNAQHVKAMLACMASLEVFRMAKCYWSSKRSHMLAHDTGDILQSIGSQDLRHLCLSKGSIHGDDLSRLLHRYRGSMRKVMLREVTLVSGTWTAVFTTIQSSSNLQALGLRDLGYHQRQAPRSPTLLPKIWTEKEFYIAYELLSTRLEDHRAFHDLYKFASAKKSWIGSHDKNPFGMWEV